MMDESRMGEIVLYHNADGSVAVDVRVEGETVWLDAHQMSRLFETDRTSIVRHIGNIYRSQELPEEATCAKIAQVAADGRVRRMNIYNLDMIISVGYRVNSKRGTQFRIWANTILKEHLLRGYSLNRRLLSDEQIEQFQKSLSLFPETVQRLAARGDLTDDESVALMKLVTDYASSWVLLRRFDEGELEGADGQGVPEYRLEYKEAQRAVATLKSDLMSQSEASELFGRERDASFEALLGNIYQTFAGQDLYSSIEQKAAHLLYFVIKDHPFSDGNKRIGALLFLYFLERNGYLKRKNGATKIDPVALVALALLVAESNPKQKELMVQLIIHFLAD